MGVKCYFSEPLCMRQLAIHLPCCPVFSLVIADLAMVCNGGWKF